jgi:mono/diheme cytochrome c family protein
MTRSWIALSAGALTFVVLGATAQERGAGPPRAEDGRRLFTAQGCHGCHTIGTMGTPIGPELSHVGAKYSESYLRRWLRDPAEQRPHQHMPKLELTEPQIDALAAFLASLK